MGRTESSPHNTEMPTPPERVFEGSVVVVTGSSDGIGEAFLRYAKNQGAQVLGLDINPPDRSKVGGIPWHYADVTQRSDMELAANHPLAAEVDYLILSAGVGQAPSGATGQDDHERMSAVNVGGMELAMETFRPRMKPGATVILLSSDLITRDADEQRADYRRTKLEVARLGQQWWTEFPDVRILTLLPGPVDTGLFRAGKDEEAVARIAESPGIMTPHELVQQVERVLANERRFPSGAMVRLYAGREPESVDLSEVHWSVELYLDAVEAAPDSHRVVYEDEAMRILLVTVEPGEREPMHIHTLPSVMIEEHSPRLDYHTEDGETIRIPEYSGETPKMEWMEPEGPHAVENVGDKPYSAVRIEYKNY